MNPQKIIILGAGGMLAHDLITHISGISGYELVVYTRQDLDITDRSGARSIFIGQKPTWVINAAAYTAVDACETVDGARQAFLTNSLAPQIIAEEAKSVNAGLIHISTDYVFDGSKKGFYDPEDMTHPLSLYGLSKELGEQLIQAAYPLGSYILRTSWLYGGLPYRESMGSGVYKNFVNTMLRLLAERDLIRVVNEQYGTPTHTMTLVHAIIEIISTDAQIPVGIHHVADSTPTPVSWYEFAREIARLSGHDPGKIVPCTTSEYPTPAVRPLYTPLQCAGWVRSRDWREALRDFLFK